MMVVGKRPPDGSFFLDCNWLSRLCATVRCRVGGWDCSGWQWSAKSRALCCERNWSLRKSVLSLLGELSVVWQFTVNLDPEIFTFSLRMVTRWGCLTLDSNQDDFFLVSPTSWFTPHCCWFVGCVPSSSPLSTLLLLQMLLRSHS